MQQGILSILFVVGIFLLLVGTQTRVKFLIIYLIFNYLVYFFIKNSRFFRIKNLFPKINFSNRHAVFGHQIKLFSFL